jgi:hypothetical protein
MPTAYLEDVQEAILEANRRFTNNAQGGFNQHFETATVPVIFQLMNHTRWDYGHPAMYRFERQHIPALTRWWTEVEPTGVVLPPQHKPALNCHEINVQRATGGRLFNYHVALV